jgi:hypothetical protein
MLQTWRRSALVPFVTLVGVSLARNAESHRSPRLPAQHDSTAILVGAGDIADCKNLAGAEATAKLLDQIPGTVMALCSVPAARMAMTRR